VSANATNRLKNYRDLSTNSGDISAGFQFEFNCECCDYTWRSPFKAHRTSQITAWLSRLAFLSPDLNKMGRSTGVVADASFRNAKDEAFLVAQSQVAGRFHKCACGRQACESCWDEDRQLCAKCIKSGQRTSSDGYSEGGGEAASGPVCPNCQTPSQGGRFCHECGFDMASTHKGCPGCGAVMPRAARFCTDRGHGF
jgi:hypothetical protein